MATATDQETDQAATEEKDISLEEAKSEQDGKAPEAKPKAKKSAVETLEPKGAVKDRTVGAGDNAKTYKQKPMSFFQKMDFFALLGDAIDQTMSGEDGLTVDGMLTSISSISDASQISAQQFATADSFVHGIAKLSSRTPDLLKDCFCVWLGVPQGERPWAKLMMDQPEDEGGLSDEESFDIIDTFIDQNWEAMNDFFVRRIRELAKMVQARRAPEES